MSVILGSGDYTYEVVEGWGTLPDGWAFGDVGGVGVDEEDRVYVFGRTEHPMIVFDRDGNFITSWGEGIFRKPHGLQMAPDGTIFCTDDGDHSVRQCTRDGRVLLTLGNPKAATAEMRSHINSASAKIMSLMSGTAGHV